MKRRDFLAGLLTGAAGLLVPARTIFLPPRGGWDLTGERSGYWPAHYLAPMDLNDGDYAEIDMGEIPAGAIDLYGAVHTQILWHFDDDSLVSVSAAYTSNTGEAIGDPRIGRTFIERPVRRTIGSRRA
jgi:hypothetical protein